MELWPVPACAERGSVCWGAQGLQLVPRTSSGPRRHLPCRPLALSTLAARLSAAGRAVRMRHENGAVRGVRGGSLQGLGGQSGAAVWESGKPPGCPPAVTWARTCHLPQAGREMVWAKSHPEARSRPRGSTAPRGHGASTAGRRPLRPGWWHWRVEAKPSVPGVAGEGAAWRPGPGVTWARPGAQVGGVPCSPAPLGGPRPRQPHPERAGPVPPSAAPQQGGWPGPRAPGLPAA